MNKRKLKISKLNSLSQIANQTYYKTPLFNSNHNDFSKNWFESTKILMPKDSEPKLKIEDIESENRIGRKSLLRKRNLSWCNVQTYVQNQSFSDTILDKIMLPNFTTPSKFKPKQNSKNNLIKCGYRGSSSVVSNLIQNNSSSTVLNYINAVFTKENSVDNIKLNKLETISRNSSVSSTRNSSKSNLKLATTQRSGSIYSKRKCEELYHALNDIGHNLYDSFSLPPFQQKWNKDSTSSKQNLEQKADNVISVLEKKNKVNINKAIIFQSKAKAPNAELNNIQRIRFGRRSNHTDFKVMQFL